MTRSAEVTAFARGLLLACPGEAEMKRTRDELGRLVATLEEHPALQAAFLNPGVPPAARKATAGALAERLGVQPEVRRFFELLVEGDRTTLLPAIARVYRARLREQLQLVDAEVTTAVPLPADRLQSLQESLAAKTGHVVSLSARVDPAIMGGVVARVGSTVYDGSVVRQLERVRERLLAES